MEKVVAQASTVNGQPADLSSLQLPAGSNVYHENFVFAPDLPQRTYADLVNNLAKDAADTVAYDQEHGTKWFEGGYGRVNRPEVYYGTPAGYQWIQEVASHQSYPWRWNLVPVPAWKGDREIPAPRFNRYVQDLDQDGVPDVLERRKRYPGRRVISFFSRS